MLWNILEKELIDFNFFLKNSLDKKKFSSYKCLSFNLEFYKMMCMVSRIQVWHLIEEGFTFYLQQILRVITKIHKTLIPT